MSIKAGQVYRNVETEARPYIVSSLDNRTLWFKRAPEQKATPCAKGSFERLINEGTLVLFAPEEGWD